VVSDTPERETTDRKLDATFSGRTVHTSCVSVRVYIGLRESGDGVSCRGYEVNIWNQGGDAVVL
jgi:hypothetical protein